jgi:Transcriptional regulator
MFQHMTGKQTDRRIRRTKRMLRDALSLLISKKGFDAITISDLTDTADINRATFYLHYHDKKDLLKKSEDDLLSDIETISRKSLKTIHSDDLKSCVRENKPVPFFVELLTYIKANSDFIKVILGPKGDLSFHFRLKKIMEKHLMLKLKEEEAGKSSIPSEYIVSYVISADLGIVQYWLERGMKESPETIALFINQMTYQGPTYAAGYR